MAEISRAIAGEFGDLSAAQAAVLVIRLLVAGSLGALLGWERTQSGKAAGLRTHILVAIGSASLVAVAMQSGFPPDPLSRVLQGLVAGIGFIGAGCIMKSEGQISGLTTAAGIWLTAAVGVTAGLGRELSAILIGGLGWFTLAVLGRWETRLTHNSHPRHIEKSPASEIPSRGTASHHPE
jgi:putative Mg2+ transporter-C (MgtC) family protein